MIDKIRDPGGRTQARQKMLADQIPQPGLDLNAPFVTDEMIKIGRQAKRIAKLIKQRDYFKKQFEHYQHVLNMQPHLETRFSTYSERVEERKRVKFLEQRVEEQALLIKKLWVENND